MKKRYIIITLVAIFVLLLPIIIIGIIFIFLSKNIFDNPDFWYGYMTYFGTVGLAIVSLLQNKRQSEENLYYQKVTAQKLYPIISIKNIKSSKCETILSVNSNSLHKAKTFYKYSTSTNFVDWEKKISVNLDCDTTKNIFCKTISFSSVNISDAFIRHILIDDIVVCGFKDKFEYIHCSNEIKGDGFSALLKTNDCLPMTIDIYFKNCIYKEAFDDPLAGLNIILFFTNTTITGIKQKEYISLSITEKNVKVSYGDTNYDKLSKQWKN